ncbi:MULTISPECIES: hypothetical protein [Kitasatospora]|uniref:Uncharacterized protein n=1 Tax=Kitasatospora setae (strain ATCC 33774 / DSM 43861 / JCM 3304 / KCC A-0304 / NBRC 14216 / KM-6054) TaxID=452652 RepID=E4N4A6_KITSK|nr:MULTISPECIES: hypothetical protein [Kitasatospora]BAJ26037.1 hypothetical protein KSE_01870 [Kitasatospora setae KM-6054]
MAVDIRVEPLGDREYLVEVEDGSVGAATRIRVTDGVLEHPGLAGGDEGRIVRETVAFLAERQPVIDIPPMIDLDDLADAYGDAYLDELVRRLGQV